MEWRPVRGFEGEYLVSDSGDIKSVTRNVPNKANRITVKERILKPWIDNWGYMNVCLFKNGKGTCKKVHRLIAEAFISPYHGEQVNHKDGNKLNNSIDNLEWCTGSENMHHAYHNGLHSSTSPVVLVEFGILFPTTTEAAKFVNGKTSGIRRCISGRNKTHRGYHFVRPEEDA